MSFLLVIPMAAQRKKATVHRPKKTTVAQPQRVGFNFQLQADGTFGKAGETDYYVAEFVGKTAHQLYMDVLEHISTIYSNPDYVTTKVADRSIVVNGYSKEAAFFYDKGANLTGVNYNYRIELLFKDGKIRVNAPVIKEIETYTARWNQTYNNDPYDRESKSLDVVAKYILNDEVAINAFNKNINLRVYAIVYGVPGKRSDDW